MVKFISLSVTLSMGTFAFSHKKLFDISASDLSAVEGNTK